MKVSISIPFNKLHEFEYIKEGNKLPNLIEKLSEIVGVDRLDVFLNTYHENEVKDDIMRYHAIGTLILNAKLRIGSIYDSFGMEYSGMVCVTYHNNSSPNLLEFFIVK